MDEQLRIPRIWTVTLAFKCSFVLTTFYLRGRGGSKPNWEKKLPTVTGALPAPGLETNPETKL
jgi:hypothetical protein